MLFPSLLRLNGVHGQRVRSTVGAGSRFVEATFGLLSSLVIPSPRLIPGARIGRNAACLARLALPIRLARCAQLWKHKQLYPVCSAAFFTSHVLTRSSVSQPSCASRHHGWKEVRAHVTALGLLRPARVTRRGDTACRLTRPDACTRASQHSLTRLVLYLRRIMLRATLLLVAASLAAATRKVSNPCGFVPPVALAFTYKEATAKNVVFFSDGSNFDDSVALNILLKSTMSNLVAIYTQVCILLRFPSLAFFADLLI